MESSLESHREELRDVYVNFKDFHQRCIIDFKKVAKLDNNGVEEQKVYYFKPETFLLDDPEK
jgi:hypothetical protein